MLNRKPREVPFSDLIDLLLDSDEETRRLVLFEALQSGEIKKSEAEQVIAQVERLERAAAPWHRPQSVQKAAALVEPVDEAEPVQKSVALVEPVQKSVALVEPVDEAELVEHVVQAA